LLQTMEAADVPTVPHTTWAKTAEGGKVEIYTLTNAHGLRARVMTWGASIVEMSVPDRDGQLADVTLGFDSPEPYLVPHPFFGAIAGRFANRIAKGKFTLDGHEHTLATNNGPNHLHGGVRGFDKRNWTGEPVGANAVRFRYTSPNGEEGYPGTLQAAATYTLTDNDELRLDYEATTDQPTVLNLTNHAFWNLSGHRDGALAEADIRAHELRIPATRYTVVDAESIPTGELRAAADSVMDFTTAKPLGRDLAALKDSPGSGYDHNYVLDPAPSPALAAELRDPASGRTMRVFTTEPAIQLYTGNYLNNVAGKGGAIYAKYAGVCLETQHFPDAPNQPSFPSAVLRPGQTFHSTTVYQFSSR
jgi:aldose 1-epimerase